jgi:predicted 2-oxoglutarate/Fe(II)-dependent dioxygenase YbiX
MVSIPTDTKYFVKIYEGVFDSKFCKSVVKEVDKNVAWQEHDWNQGYNDTTGANLPNIKGSNELSIGTYDNKKTQEIMNRLWLVLDDYYKTVLNNFTWATRWHGYSKVRYNKYEVNQEMKLHCDHIYTLFTGSPRGIPTLTILGTLNDNYEGGDLYIIDEKVIMKTGSVVIFPSNFMYPHCVTPITKGKRFSYVSWVWG